MERGEEGNGREEEGEETSLGEGAVLSPSKTIVDAHRAPTCHLQRGFWLIPKGMEVPGSY